MFVRVKPVGLRKYIQIVESRREDGAVKQRVLGTLGRLDRLQADGVIDGLVKSLSRFALRVRLVEGQKSGRLRAGRVVKVGPAAVVERLWRDLGLARVIEDELRGRGFEFSVERAVFLTVLHRLFASGSDRACEKWKRDYRVRDVDGLELHHLYRAMAWLGTNKDAVERSLFDSTRDLFTELDMVFFDTTSIYFEGEGGETVGRYGHSKDHRPDLKQMVVGAVLDGGGRPVSCELWSGDHADAKALVPVVDRLRDRFGISKATIVADRGMISKETIGELEKRAYGYILGARMRRVNEVRIDVLSRAGRFREVAGNLRVKDVSVEGRRYVVCLNPDEAEKDRVDREAILASLTDALKKGPKALVGNKGYRRYLRIAPGSVEIFPREDRGGGAVRRQVRSEDEPRPGRSGGRGEVQATLARRTGVQNGEVRPGDAARIPQVRRDDHGPRLLLVPRARGDARDREAPYRGGIQTGVGGRQARPLGAHGGGGLRGRGPVPAQDGLRRVCLEGIRRGGSRGAARGRQSDS
jgi:hypothetical protein